MKKNNIFVLILCTVLILSTAFSLSGCLQETFVWDDIVLSDKVPKPESEAGKIYSNYKDRFSLYVEEYTYKSYLNYVEACKAEGYTVEAEEDDNSYTAFHADGYELRISFYSDKMHIELTVLEPLEELTWPTTGLATMLPTTGSTIGSINSNSSTYFSAIVGEMSFDNYNNYVKSCENSGFTEDFNKGEKTYSAKNAKGYSLRLSYEGFNRVSIILDAPKEEDSNSSENSSANSNTTDTASPSGLSADFKQSMDSYENFINDYVKFMKKYQENPSDLSLLTDYAKFLSDYGKFTQEFAQWEGKDLNAEETMYYLEVQTRINEKLLEIID